MFRFLFPFILLFCIVFESSAIETILVSKNIDFSQQVSSQSPAIYIFKDSCHINTVASLFPGSILKFEGGSIGGSGEIMGNKCFIDAPKYHIFIGGVSISGFGNSEMSVHWFGAKGDNITDDATSINKAIASCESGIVKLENCSYRINSPIRLFSGNRLHCVGTIVYNGSESAIILLGQNIEIDINAIRQYSAQYTGSAITFSGNVYNSSINVNSIYGFKYGLNLSPRVTNGMTYCGIQYCKISWQMINCDYGIFFDLAGGADATLQENALWVNENQFNGGRLCCKYGIFSTKVPTEYARVVDLINGNIFRSIGFEGTTARPIKAITLDFAWYNKFHDLRLAESMISMDSTWIDLSQCGHIDLNFKSPIPYTVVNAQKCHHIEIDAPFFDSNISYSAGYDCMSIINETPTYNPKYYSSPTGTETYKLMRRKNAPDGEMRETYFGISSTDTDGYITERFSITELLQIDKDTDKQLLDYSKRIRLLVYDQSSLTIIIEPWILRNRLNLEFVCSVSSNSTITFINTDGSELDIHGEHCVYTVRNTGDKAEFVKISDF